MEQCRGGCSHEMVNSPATAATMAYPSLEEERRSSGQRHANHDTYHDDDDDDDVDHRRTVESRDHGSFSRRPVSAPPPCPAVEQHHVVHDEPCTGCTNLHHHLTSTVLNRDFAHSYRLNADGCNASPSQSAGAATTSLDRVWPAVEEVVQRKKPNERQRSRKQSQPRKITWSQEFEDEDLMEGGSGGEEERQEWGQELVMRGQREEKDGDEEAASAGGSATKPIEKQLDELKERYQRLQLTKRNLLKCRLCPDDAPARGHVCLPYHTKASLTLHKLWRHEARRKKTSNSAPKPDPPVSQQVSSSITLKATVFTNPEYVYNR